MFSWPQPPHIEYDAPPYSIVRACRLIGLQSPEDVRWCRLSRDRKRPPGRLELFNLKSWQMFLGMGEGEESKCTCGQEFPRLEMYTFTFVSGREKHYFLGQCPRCRAIYWEEP
jgi:hypothetical protein